MEEKKSAGVVESGDLVPGRTYVSEIAEVSNEISAKKSSSCKDGGKVCSDLTEKELFERAEVVWDGGLRCWVFYDTETGSRLTDLELSDGDLAGQIPVRYHLPTAKRIIQGLHCGQTVSSICKEVGLPVARVWYWRKSHPDFDENMRMARKGYAESCHDRAMDIADRARVEDLGDKERLSLKLAMDGYHWGARANDASYGGGKDLADSGSHVLIINTGVPTEGPITATKTTVEVKNGG